MSIITNDPDVALSLSEWANNHPNPNEIMIGAGTKTYTAHEFAEAYCNDDPTVVGIVQVGIVTFGKEDVIDHFLSTLQKADHNELY